MTEAKKQHINRRAVIKSAAAAATATTLAAIPALAHSKVVDPIFALIAEAERLQKLAEETGDRAEAAAWVLGAEGHALWPVLDLERPEFEPIRNWAMLHHPDRRMPRDFIESFNARTEEIVEGLPGELARRQAQGVARLAHWDAAQARRQERFESSGYRALTEEAEALLGRHCELSDAICEAKAVTVVGAVAQIKFAIKIGRGCRAGGGEFDGNCEDIAVMNAHETLRRLVPAAA
jgi:hypothetical protein